MPLAHRWSSQTVRRPCQTACDRNMHTTLKVLHGCPRMWWLRCAPGGSGPPNNTGLYISMCQCEWMPEHVSVTHGVVKAGVHSIMTAVTRISIASLRHLNRPVPLQAPLLKPCMLTDRALPVMPLDTEWILVGRASVTQASLRMPSDGATACPSVTCVRWHVRRFCSATCLEVRRSQYDGAYSLSVICLSPSCSRPLIIGVAYDTLLFSEKATNPEQDKSTALGAYEMLACLGLSGWLARSLRMCWRQRQVWVTFGVQCVCWDCRTQPKLSSLQLPADWVQSLIDCREAATVNFGTGQRIHCSLKGVLCDCVGACSADAQLWNVLRTKAPHPKCCACEAHHSHESTWREQDTCWQRPCTMPRECHCSASRTMCSATGQHCGSQSCVQDRQAALCATSL